MDIRDITNAALIELHRQSIDQREACFDPDAPEWARDLRIEQHEAIVREMIRRGLLGKPERSRPTVASPGGESPRAESHVEIR